MAEWFRKRQGYDPNSSVPTKIPKEVMDRFTKNGLIQLVEKVDKNKFDRTPITWARDQIEELVLKEVDKFEEYGGQGRAMFRAMETFGVNGKTGLIFGSSKEPWIEAFALQEGARKLIRTGPVNITIENYRYVQYLNQVEMANRYLNTFDFAASFSIESMGFGRMDPLNPDGDLLEIQKTYCMLKDGGFLFLGVPVGWDTIIWNSHRIYGRIRLGMIVTAWDIVTMFHYDKEIPIDFDLLEEAATSEEQNWIVVVLKKRNNTPTPT